MQMKSCRLLLKAADFAARKHRYQRRKDVHASPYINHPIAVALTLAETGEVDDAEILAAALLHDTLDDTETTPAELEQTFGMTVRGYVEEVTDDKSLPKDERKQRQVEKAAKLSTGATLVKLGDKICNVTDVTHSPPTDWDMTRRRAYLDWAERVVHETRDANTSLRASFDHAVAQGREVLLHD